MHYACKGIMGRLLFAPWFDPQHVTDSYSLLGISHELYNLFLCIKVPHDLTRKPYSIAKSKHWKASEFCLFALFAGIPCLQHAVLSDEFALLTTVFHFLLSVPICKTCDSCFYSETNFNLYHLGKGKAGWDSVNHSGQCK